MRRRSISYYLTNGASIRFMIWFLQHVMNHLLTHAYHIGK
jgi:hypothetical protein